MNEKIGVFFYSYRNNLTIHLAISVNITKKEEEREAGIILLLKVQSLHLELIGIGALQNKGKM